MYVSHSEIATCQSSPKAKSKLCKVQSLEGGNVISTLFGDTVAVGGHYVILYNRDLGTMISISLDETLDLYEYQTSSHNSEHTEENVLDHMGITTDWNPDRYKPNCNLCFELSKRTPDLLTDEVNSSRSVYKQGWHPPAIVCNESTHFHEDCLLELLTGPIVDIVEEAQEDIFAIKI